MHVAQKEWLLHPYPIDQPNWVMNLVRLGESLGEKCFALLEGKEGEHQRTYLGFGKGISLTPETFYLTKQEGSGKPPTSPDPIQHLREFLRNHPSNQTLESGLIGYLDFEWGLKWQKPSASICAPNYFFRLCPINLVLLPVSQRLVLEIFMENENDREETFITWCYALDRFLEVSLNSPSSSTNLSIRSVSAASNSKPSAPSALSTTSPSSSSLLPADNSIDTNWHANISRENFLQRIRQIQKYIGAGDIFQCVPSQRFSKEIQLDPWIVYEKLRIINPSPYLYCLFADKETLVGSSPELLVSSVGSLIQTRPIAGTRPRGQDFEEDHIREVELLHDPKEMAEHAMLVDLGRNDIGRVSQYGTVKVREQAAIQRFSHVMHLVSTVQGNLDQAHDSLDALKAVFPAGTLSGAPKVRALEILQELEPEPRGAYGGALGIMRWNGDLDFCITIRTLFIQENQIYVQAGAGIVFDSVPKREYEETVHKAGALLKVVNDCAGRS
ncbi:anthranilate synthase component I family protein [Desulfitobacterium sp. Sab5]|uniref:anthranilate synthase component I family protein n=1 Tax=Desulfitobacterium nosdiversum TaxID=3375356 RepID=UPI003CEA4DCB